MDTLRELIWMANPSADSLEALSNKLCEQSERLLVSAGIQCLVEVPPELPVITVGPRLRRGILLAAKEALHNAIRHAEASLVTVALEADPGEVRLRIADNGKGFDLAAAERKTSLDEHLGLRSMKDRLADLGGSCVISSRPGQGTEILFRLPIPAEPNSRPVPSVRFENE
jgi:signal transduction histidine kinase